MLRPVYTEPENCQDCYKCIRECLVKAIRIEQNKASIIDDRCIYCGHCTRVCPTGAKKVRDGLTRARLTLSKNPGRTYLSLAPSYVNEFGEVPVSSLISAIKQLGFSGVSETALGAEMVSAETEKFLASAPAGIHISSACPVVVDYIRKYLPEHVGNITPIMSPMLAHAKMLKEFYGDEIKVIFAGPCIGKKSEADRHSDLIDVAITFQDLGKWLEMEHVAWETFPGSEEDFIPHPSGMGSVYPVEGGMLAGLSKMPTPVYGMAFSDLATIKDVLVHLNTAPRNGSLFLELLACNGGCINGPGKRDLASLALRRYDVIHRCNHHIPERTFGHIDLTESFRPEAMTEKRYSDLEIKNALAAVGKTSPDDELNCSSCGYDSCRDFAVAYLEGRAEENMCVSYMRKIAHDKATVLLQKIPAGVVLVNADLKVGDMNRQFAIAMGADVETIYDVYPGMEGALMKDICPFENLFRTVLTTGEELKERRVKSGEKTWLLSVYNIQPHRLVFGLLQDLNEPVVHKEWMLEKTREVIVNHMTTVQQVAGLLGENAAFTDATLRSVMEAFTTGDDMKTTE